MSHLDPIAYTYEADHHCESCAEKRFGRNALPVRCRPGQVEDRPMILAVPRDGGFVNLYADARQFVESQVYDVPNPADARETDLANIESLEPWECYFDYDYDRLIVRLGP